MTSKLDFSSNNETAHCPENCCCQTFDWKLFSRCHHESLCQNLFVCKDCRASDNSSLLTTLHRKCQHCVTLFVTRTSSSNHQVKLLTHQTPKEFKVPVCGRSLKTNEAPEEMFDFFFFPIHEWNESVLWLHNLSFFFSLCRRNIFGANGEIWGQLWFKRFKGQMFCFDLTDVLVSFTGGKWFLLSTLTNWGSHSRKSEAPSSGYMRWSPNETSSGDFGD